MTAPFSKPKRYRDFSNYFAEYFTTKVQKISINAGFTCPNRGAGGSGCTYCNNRSFTPDYAHKRGSITQQIEDGIAFFKYKYPEMKYLAYFQSYTNTYGALDSLIEKYEEALSVPGVVGLIVGTRPDCVPEGLLDYFKELRQRTFVFVEYGVESTIERTLERVQRGHTFTCSAQMIQETARMGIPVGAHLIIGLPGENRTDYLSHIHRLNELPITSLKLHQLQILKGTVMAREYLCDPREFTLLELAEYVEILGEVVAHLRSDIYIDRFASSSPADLLLAPKWNIKNHAFTHLVERYLEQHSIVQGMHYLGR